jgi:hypothetical protein
MLLQILVSETFINEHLTNLNGFSYSHDCVLSVFCPFTSLSQLESIVKCDWWPLDGWMSVQKVEKEKKVVVWSKYQERLKGP